MKQHSHRITIKRGGFTYQKASQPQEGKRDQEVNVSYKMMSTGKEKFVR